VIVGHLIPAGTGVRDYRDIYVANKEEYDRLISSREEFERSKESQEDVIVK
jgi:DNA-directed RNA polymerase subunit beta'